MAAPRRFVPSRDGYWDGFAFEIDRAFPDLYEDIERHRERVRSSGAPVHDAINALGKREPAGRAPV